MSCEFSLAHYGELLEAARAGGYRWAFFDRVEMTMSPSRNGKPSHRPLSSSSDRYRIGSLLTGHDPTRLDG